MPDDIHADGKFAPLEAFDAGGLADACAEPWWNQTLCQVNESVARIGVFHGEVHWHKHDHEDELFFVLEGRPLVDLEAVPPSSGRGRASSCRRAWCRPAIDAGAAGNARLERLVPRRPAESVAPIDAETVLDLLRQRATRETLDGMARYAIPSDRAFGVMMRDMQSVAKQVGRSHDLAEALWRTGWYEARMVASMVDVPAYVTSAQMESWCADFDSWAIVDTVCFHLFDRSPHAWEKVAAWCDRDEEFVRRAGFALIACLVAHDKTAPDAAYLACLPRIEAGAADGRNVVKKGVSWALRMLGRRGPAVHAGALALATRLAASPDAAARWVGKDALRDLTRQPPASQRG